jgi:hypothetical protein
MEKQAEKRKRREDRKNGIEAPATEAEAEEEPLDPNDPYYLAKFFERQASE